MSDSDEPARLATLRERLNSQLGEALEEQLTEVLEQWSTGEVSDREAVREEVVSLRDRLLAFLSECTSAEALRRGTAVAYSEAKCRWISLTLAIQERTQQEGRVDDRLVHRATCVSLVVQQLEELVRQDDLQEIADFLTEPLE